MLKNGHSRVPVNDNNNPVLGRWCLAQRIQYRKYNRKGANADDELLNDNSYQTTPVSLFEKRTALLNEIKFEWDTQIKTNFSWEERYEELRTFIEEYGHSCVPQKIPQYFSLGKWVCAQRLKYKKATIGETSDMSAKQIELLYCVGFEWNASGSMWDERFEILKKYVKQFGDARVSMNYSGHVELGAWVTGQRFLLKLQVDKKVEESNRKMEARREERIILLNKIGFEWDDSGSKWDEKYEEMKIFMREFGDIHFAQQYLHNTTELGIWVNQQKVNYERYLGGDKTSVSKRQIKLLTDVGFSFGAFKSQISVETIPKYNIPDQSDGKHVLPSNVIKDCNSGHRNERSETNESNRKRKSEENITQNDLLVTSSACIDNEYENDESSLDLSESVTQNDILNFGSNHGNVE